VSARAQLREIFSAALAAAEASRAVERGLGRLDHELPAGPLVLLAAGKAACPMAEGALRVLGERIEHAEIATKDGHGYPVGRWLAAEASHPLPDARGVQAAERALERASGSPALPLLVLLSGGASAIWTAPAQGLSLRDQQETTSLLLRSGADIAALNTVRKHLSRIKGGSLARAAGGRALCTLAISDVAGDVPEVIGSGPTVPDPTRFADALSVVRDAGIAQALPPAVREHLEAGARGERAETPKPGDPCFARVRYAVVASLADALDGARRAAEARGLRWLSLGAQLYGEARELGSELAAAARVGRVDGVELLVAGGEPTVTVRGRGVGGRAQELALAFARAIAGERGIHALFAGTDGSDGPTDAAGAFADGSLVDRARGLGLDPDAALAANDSHALLARTGDLFATGPTRTNVTDLALIRISNEDC
jgi:glycerate-2-kinase